MELNLFQNLTNELKKANVSKFIKELTERLNIMEEELVIDRFEENIAICENRKTGEIKNINRNDLPKNISEGDCIKYVDGKYVHDIEKQQKIEKRIEDKMNRLWKD